MERPIIRKGDRTSHGGTVLEGSPNDICEGKPIAFVGHKVSCPKCSGIHQIIEGAPATMFYGKGIALAGMKTSCGAILIASQFVSTVWCASGRTGPTKSMASNVSSVDEEKSTHRIAGMSAEQPVETTEAVIEEYYVFVDQDDLPVPGYNYKVESTNGKIKGRTGSSGKTESVLGHMQSAKLTAWLDARGIGEHR